MSRTEVRAVDKWRMAKLLSVRENSSLVLLVSPFEAYRKRLTSPQ